MARGGLVVSEDFSNESMLEVYIFEMNQIIQQLEQVIMECEQSAEYEQEAVNEIFRLMHTIKGSSAMMLFDNVSSLAHCVEDLFFALREKKPENFDCEVLSDIVFESIDFIKVELEKIKSGDHEGEMPAELEGRIKRFLEGLEGEGDSVRERPKVEESKEQQYYIPPSKQEENMYENCYRARIYFEDGCQMENIRAYTVVHHLKEMTNEVVHLPKDIINSDESIEKIRNEGFQVFVKTDKDYDEMNEFFMQTIFLKELEFEKLDGEAEFERVKNMEEECENKEEKDDVRMNVNVEKPDVSQIRKRESSSGHQNFISVNVSKLDMLMDLVGEMVIAEAMVTQNPQVKKLEIEGFEKASRHLHKISNELQDAVMSIRMVPLSNTFFKMTRILRDMCKKLSKEARLQVIGENTEVDKNIIEHISDPLMHLIRNSMDHGIESANERVASGKPREGTVTLEAKNEGSDVVIIVSDDGRGLDRDKLLQKAFQNGLVDENDMEMSDSEVYNLIFRPGFSTKENISEFSGRGVGMDVVTKNIEAVGGTISVRSKIGEGSSIIIKIPLTLAIIDGMNIRVGRSSYTIPVSAIRQSFRAQSRDLIKDPHQNEMIMVRGECYPIVRLHEFYGVSTNVERLTEGILVMVEQHERRMCIFADELIGQQQVVVKGLPSYIKRNKRIKGISGCTLLGDGSISLILNVAGLSDGVK